MPNRNVRTPSVFQAYKVTTQSKWEALIFYPITLPGRDWYYLLKEEENYQN